MNQQKEKYDEKFMKIFSSFLVVFVFSVDYLHLL